MAHCIIIIVIYTVFPKPKNKAHAHEPAPQHMHSGDRINFNLTCEDVSDTLYIECDVPTVGSILKFNSKA